jgi:hypothetical protein
MILYHFSTIARSRIPGELACRLPEEGLLPHAERFEHATCVWLTSDPAPGITELESNCLRFAVRIASGDRHLVGYRKWLRRAKLDPSILMHDEPRTVQAMRAWWLYFGTIPCTAIVGFELLRGARPWWLENVGASPLMRESGSPYPARALGEIALQGPPERL